MGIRASSLPATHRWNQGALTQAAVTATQRQIGLPPTQGNSMISARYGSRVSSQQFLPTRTSGPTPMLPPPLTPGTFPAPGGPGPMANPFDSGPLVNSACNFISDARLRALCVAAASIPFPGGGGSSPQVPQFNPQGQGCPTGYRMRADGSCQAEGLGPYLPGDVGPQDFGWGSVLGRYGAGYAPIKVQRDYRACPPGSKLGKDGVCYDRLARSNRMHDPGARPFLTGGEVNAIRRAKRLQKRFAKLRSGKNALFPSSGGTRCSTKRKKR